RGEAKAEDLAPEHALAGERDQRLPEVAEGQLPELVHQPPRAAAAVRHADDRGRRAGVALETGEQGEGAGAAADGRHLPASQSKQPLVVHGRDCRSDCGHGCSFGTKNTSRVPSEGPLKLNTSFVLSSSQRTSSGLA